MSVAGIAGNSSTTLLTKRPFWPTGVVPFAPRERPRSRVRSPRPSGSSMPHSSPASLIPAQSAGSSPCCGSGAPSRCAPRLPKRSLAALPRSPRSTCCSNSNAAPVKGPRSGPWTWLTAPSSKPFTSSPILRRITMTSPTTPTKTTTDLTLATQLERIGMRTVAGATDDLIARATSGRWSPATLLEEIARIELTDRGRRSLERRLRHSRVGRFKPMADFDWDWARKIDSTRLEQILALAFLREERNVVLMGPNGVGKTMIARNLVHAAIHAGYTALFRTAAELLDDLSCDS